MKACHHLIFQPRFLKLCSKKLLMAKTVSALLCFQRSKQPKYDEKPLKGVKVNKFQSVYLGIQFGDYQLYKC